MSDNNKPVQRIDVGTASAEIFENRTAKGTTYFQVQFTRTYRSGEDWKHSRSFRKDDLLPLSKVADQAHTWILFQLRTEPLNRADDSEIEE